jgi:hypothetical protein
MPLTMSPTLWQALCATAARYPTCTLRLHQHQGCVKSFTVEHGPGAHAEDEPYPQGPLAAPTPHTVQIGVLVHSP